MKKLFFGFILFFSFILLGVNYVNASELLINNLGYSSCLDNNDNLSYSCSLDTSTGLSIYNSSNPYSRVSNYFLVSDGGYIFTAGAVNAIYIYYYDNNYNYVSKEAVNPVDSNFYLNIPVGGFFARVNFSSINQLRYINDDLNSVSSLNVAIDSLTHTVAQTLTIITTNTILLISTAIFLIGICLYLIWRIVRGG